MAEPLTVEAAAGVQAFLQELHVKAEGGNAVDEETLALRMLASTSAGPGYDLSQIKRLDGGTSPSPVSAGASAEDKLNMILDMMGTSTKSPAEQVASGRIPQTTPVIVVENGYERKNVAASVQSLKFAHSMLQLYSTVMQTQQKAGGYNLDTEAATWFAFQARQYYNAMVGPFAGFYVFSQGELKKFSNKVPRKDIHKDFLGKMFDGFGFDAETLKALDNKLTTFVASIKDINPGADAPATFDFVQLLGMVPKFNATGDAEDPEWVYTPTTYVIYLKIDSKTFSESISKNNSEEKVQFNFSMTVTKCELNVKQFDANKPKFDKLFTMLTNKNMSVFGDEYNQVIEQ